ncbi:hypothetical protein FRC98_06790 [Lujinxingia vulgaris]|uniref:Uncharacterized protein n=1 Tax=Lujinxingia vulgaris TaxID=2600176 RepID=A0A5C6X9L1_9DELT|nr:hypothetical protein [Lujinxingia vulgaris]TXD38582.1 hypothetical protein FRC98_06790 [Lujinxingia vulgaris]
MIWFSPGSERPPGRVGDLWWHRPLSLDELALVLRFVARDVPTPEVHCVMWHPSRWAPSPRGLAAALAAGLGGREGVALTLVAREGWGRWYASLKRELHRAGVAVEDARDQNTDE